MWLLLCCEGYKFDVLTRSHTLTGIMVSSSWHLNHVFCFVYTKLQDVLDCMLQYVLTLLSILSASIMMMTYD